MESEKTNTLCTYPRNVSFFAELRCPDCRSVFVAEVDELSRSLDKPKEPKLSPAHIVEESPVNTPLMIQSREDSQSIGKFLEN